MIFIIIQYITVFQIFLIAIIFFKDHKLNQKSCLILFFMLCSILYLIVLDLRKVITSDYILLIPSLFVFLVPFLFLLVTKLLFEDDFIIKKWYWLNIAWIWAADFAFFRYVMAKNELSIQDPSATAYTIANAVPNILLIIFTILAIITAIRTQKDDLLDSRIKVRYIFIGFISIVLIVIALLELLAVNLPNVLLFRQIIICCIFLIVTVINITLFTFTQNFLPVEKSESEKLALNEVDLAKKDLLLSLINKEKFFLQPEVTLKTLADKIQLPEYKTRILINKTLQFRNFNSF